MKLFRAPEKIEVNDNKYLFLAGTIDMGDSENWQDKIIKDLQEYSVNIISPRRDDWDNSWKQEYGDPHFYQQVTWELSGLNRSDIILFNFLENSKSPITMLELGLFAGGPATKLVCCPDGFYRKGNIDIVCSAFKIPVYSSYEDMLSKLKLLLKKEVGNQVIGFGSGI